MKKNTCIVSLVLLLFVSLPNAAWAIFVHDWSNSIDHVTVDCPIRGITRMPVFKAPENEFLGTTGYWVPWAGTTGSCVVNMYQRVEKDGEVQFKDVCRGWVKAYKSLEYSSGRCYIAASPRP